MRLSNWCILFMMLFVMAIILPDMRETYYRQALFLTELYHRNTDRATEDALFGAVKEEYADGSVLLERDVVQEKFYRQIYQQFDVSEADAQRRISESVILEKLVNNQAQLSTEEEEMLREEMETIINEKSAMKEMEYCLIFPIGQADGYSQPLANQALYHFVELADERIYPWSRLLTENAVRFFLSGARIQKSVAP